MQDEKPYLNPNLTLNDLAASLNVNKNVVSMAINRGFGFSFYDLVNYYRVDEFKKLADQHKDNKPSVLELAFESGFNSKTTFNTAFKKFTQSTPREYLKSLS